MEACIMQKETSFKIKILPKLKALPNSWVLKTQEVARAGTPDILMCLYGKFVAIELKTDDGIISPLQKYNLEKIKTCSGLALVITPSNTEEMLAVLENLAKGCSNEFYGKRN